MFKIILSVFSLIVFVAGGVYAQTLTQSELSNKAMEAYQNGDPTQCLEYLQQAVELYPDNQSAHLNLGSFAYQIAMDFRKQAYTWEVEQLNESMGWLSTLARAELGQALIMGQDSSDETVKQIVGHAAFLLGDMAYYLEGNPQAAMDFFAFSSYYFPENEHLTREMKIVEQKVGSDYVPQPIELYVAKLTTEDDAIENEPVLLININGGPADLDGMQAIENILPDGFNTTELTYQDDESLENYALPNVESVKTSWRTKDYFQNLDFKNIVLDVRVNYEEDPHQWLKAKSIPSHVKLLWDQAAEDVEELINLFKQQLPQSMVVVKTVCVGHEILMRVIKDNQVGIDRIMLNNPPVLDMDAFHKTLSQTTFTSANFAVVFEPEGQVIPVLFDEDNPYYTLLGLK